MTAHHDEGAPKAKRGEPTPTPKPTADRPLLSFEIQEIGRRANEASAKVEIDAGGEALLDTADVQ